MINLEKSNNKNFVILNLTDFQLCESEWCDERGKRALYTIDELYTRVRPDLVTISGDIAWCGDYDSLSFIGKLLDSYKTPWAVVFGNHDQDAGIDKLDKSIELFSSFEYFRYENGPSELGRGNYIINILEDEKIIHSLVMMDTHDRHLVKRQNGEEYLDWARLLPNQLNWYKERICELKALGVPESTLITHIPIYAYRLAWDEAFNSEYKPEEISPKESYDEKYWNDGYKDSFGVKYEGISSYPLEDGAFDVIKEMAHTKNVLAGHDHITNFSISYQGIRLSFALKTGHGCYADTRLNGGTVIEINSQGKASLHHEYVDAY